MSAARSAVTLLSLCLAASVSRAQATGPAPARDTVVVHVRGAAAESAFRAIAAGPPIFRELPMPGGRYKYLAATRRETGDAELHERWADVAFVRRGTAVLRTGPSLEDARQVEPSEWKGRTIAGARDRVVAPGDLVVIPAGIAHQWRPRAGEPFSYLTLKVAADDAGGGGRGLVGVWRVERFCLVDSIGRRTEPYGQHPVGYFVYAPTGQLSIQVMHTPAVPRFASGSDSTPTAAERRAMQESYLGYFGTYTVTSDSTVVHHVAGGTLPSYIGTDQMRPYRISGANGDTLAVGDLSIGCRVLVRVR
ncbi:MAG TPA: lipocalin-like domain-containing protein [Gemmatimonadaceae bacterium]|nr:lipocalin-like domain-containing protein [Gemmatimonadaceae bacterium]